MKDKFFLNRMYSELFQYTFVYRVEILDASGSGSEVE